MRTLDKLLGAQERPPSPETRGVKPPAIGAEKAEERRFDEAKKKGEIISDVRTHIGPTK